MLIGPLIERALEKTRECSFKKAILNSLLGKGWTCVNIKKFAKELTGVIKKELK